MATLKPENVVYKPRTCQICDAKLTRAEIKDDYHQDVCLKCRKERSLGNGRLTFKKQKAPFCPNCLQPAPENTGGTYACPSCGEKYQVIADYVVLYNCYTTG